MLSLIVPKLKEGVGWYHDNGLAVCNATPKQFEKKKKKKQNKKSARYLKLTSLALR